MALRTIANGSLENPNFSRNTRSVSSMMAGDGNLDFLVHARLRIRLWASRRI